MNVNGKIDKQSLPLPDEQARVREAFEIPKSGIEEKLAALWSDLLALDSISRNDNFFALGGNSLLATQFTITAKSNGIAVETRDLFSFPTLKDLALRLTEGCNKLCTKSAIPARCTGNRTPVFVLPDGEADHSYAFELAHHIDKDIPIYALPLASSDELKSQSLSEIASNMIAMLKKVEPNGPCCLLGYSAGGIIAYEMANQLLRDGYPVAYVAMLDSHAPYKVPFTLKEFIIQNAIENLGFSLKNHPYLLDRINEMSSSDIIELVKKTCADAKKIDIDSDISIIEQRYNLLKKYEVYKAPSLSIPVHLFRANGKENLDNYTFSISKELLNEVKKISHSSKLGWETVSTDFNIIAVDGDHRSMLKNPVYRKSLGSMINQSLKDC